MKIDIVCPTCGSEDVRIESASDGHPYWVFFMDCSAPECPMFIVDLHTNAWLVTEVTK